MTSTERPSQPLDFHDVRAAIVERMPLRSMIRRTFGDLGMRHITEHDRLPTEGAEGIDAGRLDLLVVHLSEQAEAAVKMIGDIRRRRIACNPFMAILLTSSAPDDPGILAGIDAGVDGVLLKPYSAQKVIQQIHSVMDNRRPFVVTADYIGPDRRRAERPGAPATPSFVVPNLLRSKATGEGLAEARLGIEEAWREIEREYACRLVFQTLFLIRLLDAAAHDPSVALARQDMMRLPATIREMSERLHGAAERDIAFQLRGWLSEYPQLTDAGAQSGSRADAGRHLVRLFSVLRPGESQDEFAREVQNAVAAHLARRQAARAEAKA